MGTAVVMDGNEAPLICHAHKPGGIPCDRPAVPGKRVCTWHGGAPGVGAPKGNRNGQKQGFYSRRAAQETRERLEELLKVEGLTNEIAYMRAWIDNAIEEGKDIETIGKAMDILARLTRTQELLRRHTKVAQIDITAEVIQRLGGQTGLWELMS